MGGKLIYKKRVPSSWFSIIPYLQSSLALVRSSPPLLGETAVVERQPLEREKSIFCLSSTPRLRPTRLLRKRFGSLEKTGVAWGGHSGYVPKWRTLGLCCLAPSGKPLAMSWRKISKETPRKLSKWRNELSYVYFVGFGTCHVTVNTLTAFAKIIFLICIALCRKKKQKDPKQKKTKKTSKKKAHSEEVSVLCL